MMSEPLYLYHPYGTNKYFVPFSIITMCVVLVMFWGMPSLFTLILVLGNLVTIKILYGSSKINILFFEDYLRISESPRKGIRDYSWQQLLYLYHTKNFKGHRFLLLAPSELNEKQLRQYTNQGANTGRVCIDDVVVFPIESAQYTAELENYILSKVSIAD